jgi:hypothetical protein
LEVAKFTPQINRFLTEQINPNPLTHADCVKMRLGYGAFHSVVLVYEFVLATPFPQIAKGGGVAMKMSCEMTVPRAGLHKGN